MATARSVILVHSCFIPTQTPPQNISGLALVKILLAMLGHKGEV